MSARTLNLRHVRDLSCQDLVSYFCGLDDKSDKDTQQEQQQQLHSLWIGPHFGQDASVASLMAVLSCLPVHLTQLDLDLTMVDAFRHLSQQQQRQQHEPTQSENVMEVLLDRLVSLQSLSLRYEGPLAAIYFSKALLTTRTKNELSSMLSVLDFRGNHMGPTGLQALVVALTANDDHVDDDGNTKKKKPLTLPALKHLILSWNSLTDDCVACLCQRRVVQRLTCLDLSCNPALTDITLNQHLAQALAPNNSIYHNNNNGADGDCSCLLQQLILFSCPQIKTLSNSLVHLLCHENYGLQKLILLGTSCLLVVNGKDSSSSPSLSMEWQQILFALELNRCGRQALLRPNVVVDATAAPAVSAREQPPFMASCYSVPYEDLWWTNGSTLQKQVRRSGKGAEQGALPHHLKQRANYLHTNDLLLDMLACYNQNDKDLSVLYYFCRETVHQWC